MIILPAIDILGGTCVRLRRGEFETAHKVAEDPLETARSFERDGAEWLHMVDLDGSKEGRRVNAEVFLRVAAQTGLKVELGGGIRTMETAEFYLSGGIDRVILGSAALRDPDFVRQAVRLYGDKIAVGIDAKDGFAAADGWTSSSKMHYIDLAREMEQIGVRCIIFTDIARDGVLSGPNIEQLCALKAAISCDIIASGGIRDIENIQALRDAGMYGAICGKSIYSGTLSLKKALEVAANAG